MASFRYRKPLIAIAAVVLVAIAALGVFVATFDPNAYKGLAIDWMRTERNRTLVIDGPMELELFPRLALTLRNVTLSEHGRPDEFAHVDEAALSVAVWPLLSRQVQVDGISAKGVRAVWRRSADGRTNIDDLLDRDDEPAATTGGPEGESLGFDVDGVQFENLRLSVHDAVAHVDGDVAVTLFRTGRLADQAESPVELDVRLALKEPAVAGRLDGRTQLRLDLKGRQTALSDMQLSWKGDVPGARGLDVSVTGALRHDGVKGTVTAADLDARIAAAIGSLQLADTRLSAKAFALDPARRHVSLDQLSVRVAGTRDGQPLKLDLDWPSLQVDGETLRGGPVTGSLSLKGPTSVEGTFKSGAPRGTFERVALPGFETTLTGRSGPRRLGGTVRSDVHIDVAGRRLSIDGLQAALKIEEPSLQPLQLEARGQAAASAKEASWRLGGALNGNPFDTDGQVNLAAKPVAIQASATFQALDLNRLLPPAAAPGAGGASAPGAPAPGAADAPVDLSALNGLQGRFGLRAGSFAFRQYRATDLVVDATLKNGTLDVSPLHAGVLKGRVSGSAQVTAAGRMQARGAADGIDIHALLRDVADKDLLEGRGRVTVDLVTTGRNVAEWKQRLDGNAALQLRDGAVKGINLAQRLRQAKAAVSMKADAVTRASATEKTDFSELSASFVLADGIARSNDLNLKSPFLRLGGEGLVDLPRSRIDYTVRATVADTSKGQGGAELAALRGVTVPVRLTGPLDAVQWDIRWSEVAADLLKSKVGQEVQDRLKDKLGERLGLPPAAASAPAGAASRPEDLLKDKLRRLIR